MQNAWINVLDNSGSVPHANRDRCVLNTTAGGKTFYSVDRVLICYSGNQNGAWLILEVHHKINYEWIDEVNYRDSTDAIDDTSSVFLSSDKFDPSNADFEKNKIILAGYDDNLSRFLFKLTGLGKTGITYTEADYKRLNGTKCIVRAKSYDTSDIQSQCWFSIASDPAFVPGIQDVYGNPTFPQIDFVINVVFQFWYNDDNYTQSKWILINYETMKNWFQRVTSTYLPITNYNVNLILPYDNGFLLPFEGYYMFHCSLNVTCVYNHLMPLKPDLIDDIIVTISDSDSNTTVEHTIKEIIGLGGILPSGLLLTGSSNIYHLNFFRLVRVESNKEISVFITFPANATATPSVNDGEYSFQFLGKKLGSFNNPFIFE